MEARYSDAYTRKDRSSDDIRTIYRLQTSNGVSHQRCHMTESTASNQSPITACMRISWTVFFVSELKDQQVNRSLGIWHMALSAEADV